MAAGKEGALQLYTSPKEVSLPLRDPAKFPKTGPTAKIGALCTAENCSRLAVLRWPGEERDSRCTHHGEKGMLSRTFLCARDDLQCFKHARYGWPGQSVTHCEVHKEEGMVANDRESKRFNKTDEQAAQLPPDEERCTFYSRDFGIGQQRRCKRPRKEGYKQCEHHVELRRRRAQKAKEGGPIVPAVEIPPVPEEERCTYWAQHPLRGRVQCKRAHMADSILCEMHAKNADRRKMCWVEGCQRTGSNGVFGFSLRLACSWHTACGMIGKKDPHDRCFKLGCAARATMGPGGSVLPMLCKEHADPDMIVLHPEGNNVAAPKVLNQPKKEDLEALKEWSLVEQWIEKYKASPIIDAELYRQEAYHFVTKQRAEKMETFVRVRKPVTPAKPRRTKEEIEAAAEERRRLAAERAGSKDLLAEKRLQSQLAREAKEAERQRRMVEKLAQKEQERAEKAAQKERERAERMMNGARKRKLGEGQIVAPKKRAKQLALQAALGIESTPMVVEESARIPQGGDVISAFVLDGAFDAVTGPALMVAHSENTAAVELQPIETATRSADSLNAATISAAPTVMQAVAQQVPLDDPSYKLISEREYNGKLIQVYSCVLPGCNARKTMESNRGEVSALVFDGEHSHDDNGIQLSEEVPVPKQPVSRPQVLTQSTATSMGNFSQPAATRMGTFSQPGATGMGTFSQPAATSVGTFPQPAATSMGTFSQPAATSMRNSSQPTPTSFLSQVRSAAAMQPRAILPRRAPKKTKKTAAGGAELDVLFVEECAKVFKPAGQQGLSREEVRDFLSKWSKFPLHTAEGQVKLQQALECGLFEEVAGGRYKMREGLEKPPPATAKEASPEIPEAVPPAADTAQTVPPVVVTPPPQAPQETEVTNGVPKETKSSGAQTESVVKLPEKTSRKDPVAAAEQAQAEPAILALGAPGPQPAFPTLTPPLSALLLSDEEREARENLPLSGEEEAMLRKLTVRKLQARRSMVPTWLRESVTAGAARLAWLQARKDRWQRESYGESQEASKNKEGVSNLEISDIPFDFPAVEDLPGDQNWLTSPTASFLQFAPDQEGGQETQENRTPQEEAVLEGGQQMQEDKPPAEQDGVQQMQEDRPAQNGGHQIQENLAPPSDNDRARIPQRKGPIAADQALGEASDKYGAQIESQDSERVRSGEVTRAASV